MTKRMVLGTLAAAATVGALALPSTAAAAELVVPSSAGGADAVAAPCHPSHDPPEECVRKTVETITSAIAPLPDTIRRACYLLYGRPCGLAERAGLTASPAPAVCGSMKPVDCVVYYLTRWDPCLLCDGGEEAARRE